MIEPLSQQIAIVNAITVAAGAAGTAVVYGAALDMHAYGTDRVLVMVMLGPIVSGAGTSVKVQTDDNAAFTSALDIAGSSQTIADDKDNTIFLVDVINPPERYVRVAVLRATQAATCTALYLVYGLRNRPYTQSATDVSGLEIHRDKATGTA